jgi:hypothetical protein
LEYEYDGHTYKITKIGLADAKECIALLDGMGYFENGVQALFGSTASLAKVERLVFGAHLHWLNEQGEWMPLTEKVAESHFNERVEAYFNVLYKAIKHSLEGFLGGGWLTSLGETLESSEE